MEPTNSPRPLFPAVEITQELVILEKHVETERSDQEEGKDEPPLSNRHKVYMFSRLLRDLDELCELQMPYPDELLEEISENFEQEEEQEEEVEPEEEYMGISFMRSQDYSWTFGRKEEVTETPQATEESDSDSEFEEEKEADAK